MRMLAAGCIVTAGILLGSYGVSIAGVYRWEDSDGVVHFTDNTEKIPSKYRNKIREVDLKSDVPPAPSVNDLAPAVQRSASGDSKRDEQLWRKRYAALHTEIQLLKDRLPAKREELAGINRRKTKFQKRSDRMAFNELSAEITRDEERIKELETRLNELDMEAAQSAIPLEWRK